MLCIVSLEQVCFGVAIYVVVLRSEIVSGPAVLCITHL